MPKRSNDFQRLIATIYEQVVPAGGAVTESAMVYDRDSKTMREVDVLVEYRYANHEFKLVIECRDRTRKSSVEWIDCLVGKACSLLVNKVAAVSRTGFAKPAIEKAKAHGIDLLTLKEAAETDWASYPIKPGLAVFSEERYKIHDALYRHEDGYRSLRQLGFRAAALIDGQEVGTLTDVVEAFFREHLVPGIKKKVASEFLTIFRSRDDLSKTLRVESEHNFPGLIARLTDGQEIDISELKFIVHGTRQAHDVPQQHMTLNTLMVSKGQFADVDGSLLEFTIVQNPDTKEIRGKWERKRS